MDQSGKRPFKVGVGLPISEGGIDGGTPRWADILAMAQRAEELGFDSLWMPDHFFIRREGEGEARGMWECWSLLAALAASTRRVEFGPLVCCTSFRNPALLAKMADTIDEISGGRLILGLGAGWHEPEYRAFGYPFDHRASRFEEAITIIHALLHEGRVDFAGRYYEARECELRPRGPRPNGPPIMVGTGGERMLGLTAKYADSWNGGFKSVEEYAGKRDKVDRACREAGRDPATLERTVTLSVALPDAAERQGEPPPDDALSGTPEELAAALRACAREGIAHIQVRLQPNTLAGIEAFAPTLEILDRG